MSVGSDFTSSFLNVSNHPIKQGLAHTSLHVARAVPGGPGLCRERAPGGKAASSIPTHMAGLRDWQTSPAEGLCRPRGLLQVFDLTTAA